MMKTVAAGRSSQKTFNQINENIFIEINKKKNEKVIFFSITLRKWSILENLNLCKHMMLI